MDKTGPYNRWAGAALRAARRKHVTQADFVKTIARRLGETPSSPGAYGHWERGGEPVPAVVLIVVAEIAGLTASELLQKAWQRLPLEDVEAIEALRRLGEDGGSKTARGDLASG